jgi:iron complex transport system substrate-binding protein
MAWPVAWLVLLIACREPAKDSSLAHRVVSLSPSTTEAMFAIGAGDLLVGRSAHCDYPNEALELPSVGGYADPNIERIFSLQPTLVIGARGPAGPALEERLRGHGIETMFPASDSIAEVEALMVALGERLGHEASARGQAGQLHARCDSVAAWAATQPHVTVVMVFDTSPIYVAGPGGFSDELIRRAGGKNLITSGGAYPTIGLERLLALDPDVIVDGMVVGHGSGRSVLAEQVGWSQLRAVREGKVRVLASPASVRPGPRSAEGLRDVARALHGREPPHG